MGDSVTNEVGKAFSELVKLGVQAYVFRKQIAAWLDEKLGSIGSKGNAAGAKKPAAQQPAAQQPADQQPGETLGPEADSVAQTQDALNDTDALLAARADEAFEGLGKAADNGSLKPEEEALAVALEQNPNLSPEQQAKAGEFAQGVDQADLDTKLGEMVPQEAPSQAEAPQEAPAQEAGTLNPTAASVLPVAQDGADISPEAVAPEGNDGMIPPLSNVASSLEASEPGQSPAALAEEAYLGEELTSGSEMNELVGAASF